MHKNLYELIKREAQPLLLVVEDLVKVDILASLNDGLYNISFITLSELLKKLSFTYHEHAIYMVMKQYQVKYEIAITYLNNLKYIIDVDKQRINSSDLKKITLLEEIREFLIANKLLITDPLFKGYCQKKKIIIYGYPQIKQEDLALLKQIDYQYIPIDYNKNLNTSVLACQSFADELFYALEEICELIINNVPLSEIKLVGISEENSFYVKQVFKMYQIPINLNEKKSLYSYDLSKDILNKYHLNELEYNEENSIFNEVIKVINKYASFKVDKTLID